MCPNYPDSRQLLHQMLAQVSSIGRGACQIHIYLYFHWMATKLQHDIVVNVKKIQPNRRSRLYWFSGLCYLGTGNCTLHRLLCYLFCGKKKTDTSPSVHNFIGDFNISLCATSYPPFPSPTFFWEISICSFLCIPPRKLYMEWPHYLVKDFAIPFFS